MTSTTPSHTHPLMQELGVFLFAVILGSLCGMGTNLLLARWLAATTAGNAGLAVATTCTGAVHSHLVHRQGWVRLLPKIGVGAPLAYAVMRGVHAFLGA